MEIHTQTHEKEKTTQYRQDKISLNQKYALLGCFSIVSISHWLVLRILCFFLSLSLSLLASPCTPRFYVSSSISLLLLLPLLLLPPLLPLPLFHIFPPLVRVLWQYFLLSFFPFEFPHIQLSSLPIFLPSSSSSTLVIIVSFPFHLFPRPTHTSTGTSSHTHTHT